MDTRLMMGKTCFGYVVHALGGSNERLDCDRPSRHHHVGDYGRQRGILPAGKHAQLLEYPRDF